MTGALESGAGQGSPSSGRPQDIFAVVDDVLAITGDLLCSGGASTTQCHAVAVLVVW